MSREHRDGDNIARRIVERQAREEQDALLQAEQKCARCGSKNKDCNCIERLTSGMTKPTHAVTYVDRSDWEFPDWLTPFLSALPCATQERVTHVMNHRSEDPEMYAYVDGAIGTLIQLRERDTSRVGPASDFQAKTLEEPIHRDSEDLLYVYDALEWSRQLLMPDNLQFAMERALDLMVQDREHVRFMLNRFLGAVWSLMNDPHAPNPDLFEVVEQVTRYIGDDPKLTLPPSFDEATASLEQFADALKGLIGQVVPVADELNEDPDMHEDERARMLRRLDDFVRNGCNDEWILGVLMGEYKYNRPGAEHLLNAARAKAKIATAEVVTDTATVNDADDTRGKVNGNPTNADPDAWRWQRNGNDTKGQVTE